MKKFHFLEWGIAVFFYLVLVNLSHAQNSALRYFLLKPSATSMALGGSGVAYYNNAFSAHYNPALITETENPVFSSSYVNPLPFFKAIEHFYFGFSFKINDNMGLSLTGNFFKQPAQLATDTEGNDLGGDGTGNNNYHYLIKASFAYKLNDTFSFGVSLSRFDILLNKSPVGYENSFGETDGFTIDLGLFAKNLIPNSTIQIEDIELLPFITRLTTTEKRSGIQIGLSITNNGQNIYFNDEALDDPLPTVFLAGIAYWLVSSNFVSIMLTSEMENQIYEDPFSDIIRSGLDLNLYQILNLRVGYVNGMTDSRKSFATYGFGINTKYFKLNASRYNSTFLPTWHYDASLSWGF